MQSGIFNTPFGRRSALLGAVCGLVTLLAGCGGGGGGGNSGGGGGGGNNTFAAVRGQVLLVSTSSYPDSPATVTAGSVSTTTNAGDGTFTLSNVPTTTTTLNISAPVTGGTPLTRSVPLTLTANTTNDLGTIYLAATNAASDNNAVVTGRVVTTVNGLTQPVGNAAVLLAGVQTKTDTLGNFTLSNLPVGLGTGAGALIGRVNAPGFDPKQIYSETLGPPLNTGSNPVGDVVISAAAGSTPPTLPYTIKGIVTVQGSGRTGTTVTLAQAGVSVGTTTTDASGNYSFWVVPGTYTLTAAQTGLTSQQTSVTLTALDAPVTAATLNLVP